MGLVVIAVDRILLEIGVGLYAIEASLHGGVDFLKNLCAVD